MKKIALITLAVITLLLVIGQLTLPGILRSYINSHGSDLLGREVYLDDVSVNMLTGNVTLDSLTIYGQQPEEEPFVSIHQLRADVKMRHLLAGVLDMNYFKVDGLRLHIEQRDTVFNFSDILLRFSDDEAAEPEAQAEGLPIVMRNIAITNSYLHYQDLLVHSDFNINNITLRIPGIDLRQLNTSVGLDLTFFDGGHLATQFVYDERRMTYALDLQLTDFNMKGLLPYVQQHMMAEDFGGTLNGELQMRGDISHVLDFQMTGNAHVRNLSLTDQDDQEVLTCDSLAIGVSEMSLLQNRIGLTHLIMYDPMLDVTYARDSLDNFTRMMLMAEQQLAETMTEETVPADIASAPDDQPEFRLNIAQFQIHRGHLFYHDLATSVEPFHYQIGDINLNAPQFSLTGINNAKGKARMGNDGIITLEYHGKFDDPYNMRFNLGATGIQLNDFSPYTLQMFGNEILNGSLDGSIIADVHNGNLNGNIHFTAQDPKVSKRRKDVKAEMNLPFRTGVYALTDKNGVCDIELPMKGNIDEPQFSYKRLIFRTLGKLFIKVSTSPFGRNRQKGTMPDGNQYFNDFNIDDVDLDSFGTDSIGKVLMDEEYE